MTWSHRFSKVLSCTRMMTLHQRLPASRLVILCHNVCANLHMCRYRPSVHYLPNLFLIRREFAASCRHVQSAKLLSCGAMHERNAPFPLDANQQISKFSLTTIAISAVPLYLIYVLSCKPAVMAACRKHISLCCLSKGRASSVARNWWTQSSLVRR